MREIGLVVIGRNEGERLRRCLRSALGQVQVMVYVDSGSIDDSVSMARGMGVDVVELDMSRPFTAARARNEGFARIMELRPQLEFVQFVDGDVEITHDWLDASVRYMSAEPRAAAISGRRRERHPEASVFNRLCDIEWRKPADYPACEGDALMRVSAFNEVGGFNPGLIAGEEPELCVRFRDAGWTILRVPDEMTLHDAALLHVWQWWRREMRAGHAYAEGAAMHGRKHYLRQSLGIAFWGLVLPIGAFLASWTTYGASSVAMMLLYGVLVVRATRGGRGRTDTWSDALLFGVFCVLGKFPMAMGLAKYWINRLSGRRATLIEYKHLPQARPERDPGTPTRDDVAPLPVREPA